MSFEVHKSGQYSR